MESKKKTIVFILAMFMWFISSAGSLYYALEYNEIMMSIFSGLTTMMFGGFILEGFYDLYKLNYLSEGQIKIKGSLDSEAKVVSKPEMVRLRREANKKKNDKD